MKKLVTLLFVISILISCNKEPKAGFADTVIINANIYTLSWSNPSLNGIPAKDAPFKNDKWQFDAQAIAIKNNTIQFVGTDKEVEKYIGKTTKVIDVKKAVIVPGLIESHGHLQELGEKKEAINLEKLTKQQIVDLIVDRAK
ncbi:MAG: putative amidohydrolase YtcJ, partial [Polaribacter sp.]